MMKHFYALRHTLKQLLIIFGFYKYPDFLIIGAQKSGTTFLYSVLRQHPQIIEPVDKEAHFFDIEKNYKKGVFKYKLNFDLSFRFKKKQITFEATPDYLCSEKAPERIKTLLPEVKFIIILRDPISRAYSGWKMYHYLFKENKRYKHLYDPRDFRKVVDDTLKNNIGLGDPMNHIAKGLYGRQIQNYLKFFEREKFLILFQSQLKANTQQTINKLTTFLNIDRIKLDEINKNDTRYWTNESSRNASVNDETIINKLSEYYKEDKKLLESLLKEKINW